MTWAMQPTGVPSARGYLPYAIYVLHSCGAGRHGDGRWMWHSEFRGRRGRSACFVLHVVGRALVAHTSCHIVVGRAHAFVLHAVGRALGEQSKSSGFAASRVRFPDGFAPPTQPMMSLNWVELREGEFFCLLDRRVAE